jgi:hypothetical protein
MTVGEQELRAVRSMFADTAFEYLPRMMSREPAPPWVSIEYGLLAAALALYDSVVATNTNVGLSGEDRAPHLGVLVSVGKALASTVEGRPYLELD